MAGHRFAEKDSIISSGGGGKMCNLRPGGGKGKRVEQIERRSGTLRKECFMRPIPRKEGVEKQLREGRRGNFNRGKPRPSIKKVPPDVRRGHFGPLLWIGERETREKIGTQRGKRLCLSLYPRLEGGKKC